MLPFSMGLMERVVTNCLDYSNVDLKFMEYFWQEQSLHLPFVLVKMFIDGVQMSIGIKT
jgi:hypothetical protein